MKGRSSWKLDFVSVPVNNPLNSNYQGGGSGGGDGNSGQGGAIAGVAWGSQFDVAANFPLVWTGIHLS